jgi:hypothetical protein
MDFSHDELIGELALIVGNAGLRRSDLVFTLLVLAFAKRS